jgi:hypothetical protein
LKSTKNIGIWMDHSIAHFIEFKNNKIESYDIESQPDLEEKQNIGKDESLQQNIKKNQLLEYFKKLSFIIKDFKNVLLFGPTDAKTELFNFLKKDRHFEGIKIEIKNADKLTENQMHAFVKEHFEISL